MFVDDPLLDALLRGLTLAPMGLLWILLLARANGLSTFSKMTAFDFVTTVATGSLLASAASASELTVYVQNLVAVAALVAAQRLLAEVRCRSELASRVIDNEPVVVMRDGAIDDEALGQSQMTRHDLWAKLREANALCPDSVRAVVLETTGDVSVLHGDTIDEAVLQGVAST